jgi:hypothetical protein
LDFRFWILDFRFWILDFRFWILDFGLLDFGFWILDFRFWILDFGFWILGYQIISNNENNIYRTYAKYLSNPHFSVTSVAGVVRYSMNLA